MKLPNKEEARTWLKNPFNAIFILILILAIGVRFYYFDLTLGQPTWWDESEYLAAGKSFAGIGDYELNSQRNALFPIVISVFYKLGLDNEAFMRFMLLFIPSLLAIVLIYLCLKEMYPDPRIALISMALATFLWEHLFYSNRFQTDSLGLVLGLLSAYLTFKMYLKQQDLWIFKHKYAIIYIMLCAVLAFLFRTGDIIFIPLAILYILIIERTKFFKKKEVIIGSIIIVVLIAAQLVYHYIVNGSAIAGYLTYVNTENPIDGKALTSFKGFYESLNPNIPSVLYYVFLLGVIFILIELYFNRKKLLKLEQNEIDLEVKGDLYSVLNVLALLAAFILILRPPLFEFRWFFPMLLGMFSITAKGIITIADYTQYFIAKENKMISIGIILILLVPGLYYEWAHGDEIIKGKLDSYAQVREAGIWMRDNSVPGDVISSISIPQTAYYSERKISTYSSTTNETDLLEFLKKEKPKYLTVSVFEPHPPYIFTTTQNTTLFTPVNAFFIDKEKKQVVLVIYRVNYN